MSLSKFQNHVITKILSVLLLELLNVIIITQQLLQHVAAKNVTQIKVYTRLLSEHDLLTALPVAERKQHRQMPVIVRHKT